MQPRSFNLKTRLGEARKQLEPKLSAAELGRKLAKADLPEFKPAHVSSLELGYRYATRQEVEALAKELQVDFYWLAGLPRPPPAVPRAPSVARHATEAKAAEKRLAVRAMVPLPPAARAVATPVAAPASPPVPAAPAAPADLAPAEIPQMVAGAEAEYRRQMVSALNHALGKLGDTTLKPFEWRSWREYEKKIRAAAVGSVSLPE
jgi:hypothetical protein